MRTRNLTPVKLDGEGENKSLPRIPSKVGKGTVRVWYRPTSLQNLSLGITVGSLVACAGVFGIYYSRKNKTRRGGRTNCLTKEEKR